MKKTMLAGVVAASISALTLVGCNTSPSQTTEAAAPAVVETAVNDITRDYLLATDRLNTVDGSALQAHHFAAGLVGAQRSTAHRGTGHRFTHSRRRLCTISLWLAQGGEFGRLRGPGRHGGVHQHPLPLRRRKQPPKVADECSPTYLAR